MTDYGPPLSEPVVLEGDYTPPPLSEAVVLQPYYTPPPLSEAIVLEGDYTPPPLTEPVVLYPPGAQPEPEPDLPYMFTGLAVATRVQWRPRPAQKHDRRMRADWRARPSRRDAAPRQRWGTTADVLDVRWHIPWQKVPQVDAQPRVAWGNLADTGMRETFGIAWQRVPPRDAERRVAWGNYPTRIEARWAVGYSHPPAKDLQQRVTWGTQPTAISREARAVWLDSLVKDSITYRVPWGYSTAVRYSFLPGPGPVPPVIPQPPGCYTPPPGGQVRLSLRGNYTPPPGDAVALHLTCSPRALYARRSYIMSHTVSVVRLPNREPLTDDVLGIRLGIDEDSWAWTVSMTLARRASYHLLLPDVDANQEIEVAIDGLLWTFTVEDTSEDRSFGSLTRFTASGRSRTALLAAPYSPERSYTNDSAMSGAQLADRELDLTGYTLDWQGPTWTVPAGAWSYSSLTRMGAITRIAEAAGCIVQSHPSDRIVQVLPRYPALPWNWSGETPDVQLDSDALVGLGMRRLPGPKYHGVYVSGETQGVLVEVTRSGSSGIPYAELIVDPINTDNAPAIQRGGAVLAEAQDRTEQPLRLPFSQSVGVIAPTDLVEVQDTVYGTYRARASAVTIDVGLQDDAVTVRQDVTVHRHHDDLE